MAEGLALTLPFSNLGLPVKEKVAGGGGDPGALLFAIFSPPPLFLTFSVMLRVTLELAYSDATCGNVHREMQVP